MKFVITGLHVILMPDLVIGLITHDKKYDLAKLEYAVCNSKVTYEISWFILLNSFIGLKHEVCAIIRRLFILSVMLLCRMLKSFVGRIRFSQVQAPYISIEK